MLRSSAMVTLRFAVPAFLAAAMFLPAAAAAALSTYSDRASFEAQGTIVENYGFEDWNVPGSHAFPGDPYLAHGVTYVSAQNLIMGPGPLYGNSSHVIINNNWTPISGLITGSYDMLGFDLGILGTDSLIDFSIATNLSTYSFLDVEVPNVNTGLSFFGFIAGGGENITGMTFNSQIGSTAAPALDNVTLGNTAPIPEPQTYALLLAGLGLLGFAARRRRK
jgi:opacity protein-like surface antigen